MNPQDDELVFADELTFADEDKAPHQPQDNQEPEKAWKVLVVDDEPQVHTVTKLVLRDLTFKGRKIEFCDAYSASEAKKVLAENPDICLALVDVVMEEDDAGLHLVEYIRDIMNNKAIRIILRTGQPGYAPEKEVIIDYDINDYKEKTEMSAQKLITCVITAIRNYEYIDALNKLTAELEQKVADRVAELDESNRKLLEDQEAGKKLQNKILPKPEKEIGPYLFSSRLFPSLVLSGDFIDYFSISSRYIGFYMADVSGHGISSAIVTVLLKNFIDNKVEKFALWDDQTVLNPQEICTRINSILLRENLGKYLTIFYGIIDMETNTLSYANCGQFPYPAFVSGGEKKFLMEKGTPVGLFKSPVIKTSSIQLPEHFCMLLSSDGLLDILDGDLDAKSSSILTQLAEKGDSLESLVESFKVQQHGNLPDDITFMLIRK
ncbi:MAG: SpoIIE family protein phosphatase [Spirochaetia bacterium]|nr:SpoIIE family protein phosphatase [Spirochaetia bacterium]